MARELCTEAKYRVLKLGRKRDQVLAQESNPRFTKAKLYRPTRAVRTDPPTDRYSDRPPETPAAFVAFFTEGRRHMQPLTSSSNTANEKTAFFSSSEATRRKGGDSLARKQPYHLPGTGQKMEQQSLW
ncbi:hypothetical protein B296_00030100 [Ensete ventricosum]|uniref:Uncharacterized protein n=1 Tax=Ensete ventricosum TaxID=4639 RepID=A0A426ZCG5_ENSVE|nr:hypothetical protein B296_00030100 [Ensete ventricosum]